MKKLLATLMKNTSKIFFTLSIISTTFLNPNSIFAQRLAEVEDRSINVDTTLPNNPAPTLLPNNNDNNSVSQSDFSEVPNTVMPPQTIDISRKKTFGQPINLNQNYSGKQENEEIKSLEQELDMDSGVNSNNLKRKMQDLQSLSTDARIQRLENINEQQQQLKLEKRIRLLQLQLQDLTGQFEEQQHQIAQAQNQDKLLHESLDRKFADLSSKIANSDSEPRPAPKMASSTNVSAGSISKSPKGGFNALADASTASNTSNIPSIKPQEGKKSYTLQDSEVEQQSLYNAAYEHIKSRKYDQAIEKFQQYLAKYPNGQFSEGANYWLGEIYMLQSKYDKALASFDVVLTKYPKGKKSPDALYKKGLVYLYKKDFKQAKSTLSNVIKKYGKTPAANLAEKQLKNIEIIST